MDGAKTTARWYKKNLVLGFGATYTKGFTVNEVDPGVCAIKGPLLQPVW